MSTRLMVSLKKAAVEPVGPWSLAAMTDFGSGGSSGGSLRFASRMFYVSRKISETLVTPDEEAMELEPAP